MKLNSLIVFIFLICIMQTHAIQPVEHSDSAIITLQGVIDTDSLLENLNTDSKSKPGLQITTPKTPLLLAKPKKEIKPHDFTVEKQAFDSLINEKQVETKKSKSAFTLPTNIKPMQIDSLVLKANPFFIELVYENIPLNFDWNLEPDFCKLYYGEKASCLTENTYTPIKTQTPEQFIADLRRDARNEITRKAVHLYAFRFDELPDPNINKNHMIEGKPLEKILFVEDEAYDTRNRKLYIKKIQVSPWSHTASSLLQFSENAVSKNWYQGGSNNVAVLGILSGKLNYDNKKSIQWDNNAEWRMGFNSIESEIPERKLQVNDDVLRVNSKLGIKASGNWFYSGSVDFSTQFLNSYKGVNSLEKKATFLTPVRLNIGVGFDYKYKKMFSLMIAPVAYKYIYLNEKDPAIIDPKLFGIKTGETKLSELGSSFKAIFSYAPVREIQLDSKLTFYTNYQKVEIDWEMVCNFTINRFLSTRISFNPRYDNTVIMPEGERAEIQFKQMLSVGFSHKFR